MFFAALGAIGLREFMEAAAVTFLYAISEWLEVRATTRARKALSAIVRLRPEKANLVHPSTLRLLLCQQLRSLLELLFQSEQVTRFLVMVWW
jgi:Zn2+/Cd2+-exporting ATPase